MLCQRLVHCMKDFVHGIERSCSRFGSVQNHRRNIGFNTSSIESSRGKCSLSLVPCSDIVAYDIYMKLACY